MIDLLQMSGLGDLQGPGFVFRLPPVFINSILIIIFIPKGAILLRPEHLLLILREDSVSCFQEATYIFFIIIQGTMRAEHSISNKIVPVKSLVYNAKAASRKSDFQLGHERAYSDSERGINTPKNIKQKCQGLPYSYFVPQEKGQREKNRPVSFQKYYYSSNEFHKEQLKLENNRNNIDLQLDAPKTEKSSRVNGTHSTQGNHLFQQSFNMAPISSHINRLTISNEFIGNLQESTQIFKSTSLVREPFENEKDLTFSFGNGSKDQEHMNLNLSNFDKTANSSWQTRQDIYKMKNQLYQKDFRLFESVQNRAEQEAIIKELTFKLQNATISNQEINKEFKKVEALLEQTQTDKKMMLLRLKQFEINEKEKEQYIGQLKQRQRRVAENHQRIISGQKQLLKQKQQQLSKLSKILLTYKKSNTPGSKASAKDSSTKDFIIQELSMQLTDLKLHLQLVQKRMRQMIENQEEIKKELQAKAYQVKLLQEEHRTAIQDLKDKCDSKDFELTLMIKTCDEYMKKIADYQRHSQSMRCQLEKLDILKNEKGPWSTRNSLSTFVNQELEDKQFCKLKGLNNKLNKENQKLSAAIKDLNKTVNQFYNVNKGLNESIVTTHLEILNHRLASKYKDFTQ